MLTDRTRECLAALVSAIQRHRTPFQQQGRLPPRSSILDDPALDSLQRAACLVLNTAQIVGWESPAQRLLSEPLFAAFAPRSGEVEPMIRSAAGGCRLPPGGIVQALFSSALASAYTLQEDNTEVALLKRVVEHCEDLSGILSGERASCLVVCGVAGLHLEPRTVVETPWGTLRPVPALDSDSPHALFHPAPATYILTQARRLRLVIDRSRDADEQFDPEDVSVEQARLLLAITGALASRDATKPQIPVITWRSVIPSVNFGLGASGSTILPNPVDRDPVDPTGLARWCGLVATSHAPSVDIAARRLVTAILYRWDRADALIDAVMAWENLVGADIEVSFRVTAAIAKTLELVPDRRPSVRKALAKIYDARSKLVHGSTVDPTEVDRFASEAIAVGIRTMRVFYERGHAWLSLKSPERGTMILLQDP